MCVIFLLSFLEDSSLVSAFARVHAVCILVIDASDDLPDMVGHAFTMLLTLTTYSLVVGDIVPNLGYLTVLDYRPELAQQIEICSFKLCSCVLGFRDHSLWIWIEMQCDSPL